MKDSTDLQKKQSKRIKDKVKQRTKIKLRLFRIVMMFTMIGVLAAVGAGVGLVGGIIEQAPDIEGLELKPTTGYTSFIYDQAGSEMDRLSSGENRIYAELEEIPLYLQQAVIVTEDERFYEHNGIDLKGILRAIVANLTSGEFTEGASTITQQLIKNNVLTSEKRLTRKIQEQYLSLQAEEMYREAYGDKGGKDIILEYYLNTMPLGRGTNGVQAAANRYFNKEVTDLTLAESVVLACITQAPTRFDPISNPENNYKKSKNILEKMVAQGYISEAEREAALIENPYQHIHDANQKYAKASSHSYFVDAVIEKVLADLQIEKGMTPKEANELLFGGGVKIYTTFDSQMQKTIDQYISDDSLYPTKAYELKLAYSVTVKKADGSTA
ncbi:MAG: transglycosylase domain-containing protein, partial [Cellulosilyticaceae bacterium]